MKKEIIFGSVGTGLSIFGTAMQTKEILQIISLVITIIGGIITWFIIPIYNWYKKSKSDGKVDEKELKELEKIVDEAIEKIEKEKEK